MDILLLLIVLNFLGFEFVLRLHRFRCRFVWNSAETSQIRTIEQILH